MSVTDARCPCSQPLPLPLRSQTMAPLPPSLQGGATTFFSRMAFQQQAAAPALAAYSWPSQVSARPWWLVRSPMPARCCWSCNNRRSRRRASPCMHGGLLPLVCACIVCVDRCCGHMTARLLLLVVQGVWVDTDGTLLTPDTLGVAPPGWQLGAGASLHSSLESSLFSNVSECLVLGGGASAADGAVCRPGLTFRRIMLNAHAPAALVYRCVRGCMSLGGH